MIHGVCSDCLRPLARHIGPELRCRDRVLLANPETWANPQEPTRFRIEDDLDGCGVILVAEELLVDPAPHAAIAKILDEVELDLEQARWVCDRLREILSRSADQREWTLIGKDTGALPSWIRVSDDPTWGRIVIADEWLTSRKPTAVPTASHAEIDLLRPDAEWLCAELSALLSHYPLASGVPTC